MFCNIWVLSLLGSKIANSAPIFYVDTRTTEQGAVGVKKHSAPDLEGYARTAYEQGAAGVKNHYTPIKLSTLREFWR